MHYVWNLVKERAFIHANKGFCRTWVGVFFFGGGGGCGVEDFVVFMIKDSNP